MKLEKISQGTKLILEGLEVDLQDENFVGTPDRVARMYQELAGGLDTTAEDLQAILKARFKEEHNELVLVRDIKAVGICPHHLVPIVFKGQLAYISNGWVLGLSKLSRLVVALARRPVLQETLTEDVADFLMRELQPKGVAFVLQGIHGCMTVRGAKQADSTVLTSTMRGIFMADTQVRNEFLSLINV